MAGRFRNYRLPNGVEIAHFSKADTDLVYHEIFVEDVYRQHGVTIGSGDVIVDVGANVGLFALFVSQICDQATVVSCEPVPAIFRVLMENAARHSQIDLRLVNAGLSRAPGTVEFSYYPRLSCASTMYPDDSPEERERSTEYVLQQFKELPSKPLKAAIGLMPRPARHALARLVRRHYTRRRKVLCRLTTLSDLIVEQRLERVDMLKLDAERSELDVLSGIRDEHWPLIRQAVVEAHDPPASAALERVLSSRGLQVTVEQNPHFPHIAMLYATRKPDESRAG
ncbi:MAG: FkbM family methyltransferase [Pirellulales bacterium]